MNSKKLKQIVSIASLFAIASSVTMTNNAYAAGYEDQMQYDAQMIGSNKYKTNGNFTYAVVGTSIMIEGYNGKEDIVTIPEEIDGMKVTGIAQHAFESTANGLPRGIRIDKVIIPKTVTSISDTAFLGCIIAELSVDEENPCYCTVDGVLYNNTKTKLIKYPEGKMDTEYEVLDSTTTIGKDAFYIKDYDNQVLKKIVLPNTITTLEDEAFCGRNSEINIPYSLKKLSYESIYMMSEIVNIPKNISYIEREAIGNSSNVKSITVDKDNPYFTSVDGVLYTKDMSELVMYPRGKEGDTFKVPDGVKKIRQAALGYCDKLKTIEVPSSVETIENSAFIECENLEEVKLSEGIKKIEGFTFSHSHKLKSVVIPDSVTTLEKEAFEDCQGLEDVVIGSGVKEIGEGLFRDNCSLKKVTIKNKDALYGAIATSTENICDVTVGDDVYFKEGVTDNGIVYRLFDDHAQILGYTKELEETFYIPSEINGKTVTKISSKMHAYRELNANRIIVPEGVLEIEDGAFSEFRKATYIDIPRSIKTLDLSVFKTMKSLDTVFLQDGTTKLSNIDKLINKVSVNHDDIAYETTNSEVNDETDRVEDANKERLDVDVLSKAESSNANKDSSKSDTADSSNVAALMIGVMMGMSAVYFTRRKIVK